MKNIVLCDIDNTIADMDHRLHMLDRSSIDWREFEEQAVYDQPIMPTIVLLRALKTAGKQIWLWTGRSDHIKAETKVWLHRHQVPYDQLLMKPVASEETTISLKRRWLKESPVSDDRVIFAVDDDPSIVKMLREEGVLVLQVRRPT